MRILLILMACFGFTSRPSIAADSIFLSAPPDDKAVLLRAPEFAVRGDGVADDAPAVQAAIDAAQKRNVPVLVPQGIYRIAETLNLPKGVRLIGFGATRPKLLLAENTPGWSGDKPKYMVAFRPQDGRQGNDTFYSGIININFEMRPGNANAVAVRYDVAQGCVLKNADFQLSPGQTAIERLGNEISNCRFFGGDYALRGGNNIAWQTLVMDCVFDGQRKAAIETFNSGLTLIRGQFRGAPLGINIPPGKIEHLYVKDCRFENVATALSLDAPKNGYQKLNVENIMCANVPLFADVRSGEKISAPAPLYALDSLADGLQIRVVKNEKTSALSRSITAPRALTALPPLPISDVPTLPPVAEWANVRDFGAVGDGKTDDTAALRKAIAARPVLFLPSGRYLLSDTLQLRPDTTLIGLQPRQTMLEIKANTPGYGDAQAPKSVVQTPPGGSSRVVGIGISLNENPGAIAALWGAGENSLLDDFWISWSNGGPAAKGQSGGLVITGGGTFKNLWIANEAAPGGVIIRDTKTPGRAYLWSIEHHHEYEVRLRNVSNWKFYALQTEDGPASLACVPVDMENCRDLFFANLYLYRTSGNKQAAEFGVRAKNSDSLRFRGIHSYSLSPFPAKNTFASESTAITEREIALLEINS